MASAGRRVSEPTGIFASAWIGGDQIAVWSYACFPLGAPATVDPGATGEVERSHDVTVDSTAWLGAAAIAVLLAVVTVGALAVTRRRSLAALLLAAATGAGGAWAGTAIPLADGLAVTHDPVQTLVLALFLVGGLCGWIVGTRRLMPLIVAAASLVSFAITVQLVYGALYPSMQHG